MSLLWLALKVRRRLLSRGGALREALKELRLLVLVLRSRLWLLLELLREGGRVCIGSCLRRRVGVAGAVGESDGLLGRILPVWSLLVWLILGTTFDQRFGDVQGWWFMAMGVPFNAISRDAAGHGLEDVVRSPWPSEAAGPGNPSGPSHRRRRFGMTLLQSGLLFTYHYRVTCF